MASANTALTGSQIATMESDSTARTVSASDAPMRQLVVHNVGSNAAAIRIGSGSFTTTNSGSPTNAANEFILASGKSLVLPPVGTWQHFSTAGTFLSVAPIN